MTGDAADDLLFGVNLAIVGESEGGREFVFGATEEQCSAMACRFGCVSIDAFEVGAKITPLRKHGQFRIKGYVKARVVQNCVVSLEPVVSDMEQDLDLVLLPEDLAAPQETGFEDDEFETYSGDIVDLGEIGAVELALAIDPYPRAPNVSLTDLGPGSGETGYQVLEEGNVSRNRPFEALAAIKGKS